MRQPKTHETEHGGFTIIEVVLVLAIAGLLLLMVFVALPSFQRSQRDAQRRQDMARLITAVQNYQANNGNQSPIFYASRYDYELREFREVPYGLVSSFIENYLEIDGDTFNDPLTGESYYFGDGGGYLMGLCAGGKYYSSCVAPNIEIEEHPYGIIDTHLGYQCDGQDIKEVGGKNRMAFTIKLENGGIYCVDI